MIDYENLVIERERPDYPTGLKHYKKDTVAENSLFDIDLMAYKAVGIVKGQDNDRETSESRSEAESGKDAEEVRRGNLLGLLLGNRDSEVSDGADGEIERRYIEIDEREQEEREAGTSVCKAETEKTQNED